MKVILRYERPGGSWFEVWQLGEVHGSTRQVVEAVTRALGCDPERTIAAPGVDTGSWELHGGGHALRISFRGHEIELADDDDESPDWTRRADQLRRVLP